MSRFNDRQVIGITKKMDKFLGDSVKKVTLDIKANLEEDTPKDTSWAASNWVPSKTTPYEKFYGFPEREQKFALLSGAHTENKAGVAELLTYKVKDGAAWISNNVEYINDLNAGSSKKAPSGFVQKDIQKAVVRNS